MALISFAELSLLHATGHSAAVALLALLFSTVLLLNLLIAIMSDSYERVKDGEELEARKLTAQTIIDEEALMSQSDLDNPLLFPQSIQVLQSHKKPERPWAGVGSHGRGGGRRGRAGAGVLTS